LGKKGSEETPWPSEKATPWGAESFTKRKWKGRRGFGRVNHIRRDHSQTVPFYEPQRAETSAKNARKNGSPSHLGSAADHECEMMRSVEPSSKRKREEETKHWLGSLKVHEKSIMEKGVKCELVTRGEWARKLKKIRGEGLSTLERPQRVLTKSPDPGTSKMFGLVCWVRWEVVFVGVFVLCGYWGGRKGRIPIF